MIVALFQAALQIGRNPAAATRFLEPFFISKIIVLVLAVIYVIFAIRVWVQVRRLEVWLPLLRGRKFSLWALLHLGWAIIGFILTVVVL